MALAVDQGVGMDGTLQGPDPVGYGLDGDAQLPEVVLVPPNFRRTLLRGFSSRWSHGPA